MGCVAARWPVHRSDRPKVIPTFGDSRYISGQMPGPEKQGYEPFITSDIAESILRDGDIVADDESPADMFSRVADSMLVIEEEHFRDTSDDPELFAEEMLELFLNRKVVPATSILMNIGRFPGKPLSSCVVPPVDLDASLARIKSVVDKYHEDGMGTGFNLEDTDNPIEVLFDLQEIARTGLEKEEQRRPVGNMAIMRIDNPLIDRFIRVKQANQDVDWKFNISIDVTEEFIQSYHSGGEFELRNEGVVDPRELMSRIADSAGACGDPGLVFLDRMNRKNAFSDQLSYKSVAPCGEVGLVEGEVCHFANINIAAFANRGGINWGELRDTVKKTTRFLDNILEYSLHRFSFEASEEVNRKTRKIGIGYCGYSELLLKLGLRYGSAEARQILRDTLAFINYHSKIASSRLAAERGTFGAWNQSKFHEPAGFLTEKFGDKRSRKVDIEDWRDLDRVISEQGLRNSTTVILPPTGRSSRIIDTTQQIEPIFSLFDGDGRVREDFKKTIQQLDDVDTQDTLQRIRKEGSCQNLNLPTRIKERFRTAVEIGYREHFDVQSDAQKFVDESVSKTINLPSESDSQTVENIYVEAFDSGLNGITIYQNSSNPDQPVSQ